LGASDGISPPPPPYFYSEVLVLLVRHVSPTGHHPVFEGAYKLADFGMARIIDGDTKVQYGRL
jgi:hypothetical protein